MKTAAKKTHAVLILTHFEMVLLTAYLRIHICMCTVYTTYVQCTFVPIQSKLLNNLPISCPNNFCRSNQTNPGYQLRYNADTAIKGTVSRDFK
jgi:hypothetical protein